MTDKLYISNISKEVDEDHFREYLMTFGPIKRFEFRTGKNAPHNKYCFLNFRREESTVDFTNKIHFENPFNIIVCKARPARHDESERQADDENHRFSTKQNNLNYKGSKVDIPPEEEDEDREECSGECLLCKKKAIHICCCSAWYCSKKCQLAHWNVHYVDCEPSLTIATPHNIASALQRQKKFQTKTNSLEVRKESNLRCFGEESNLSGAASRELETQSPRKDLRKGYCEYEQRRFSRNKNINGVVSVMSENSPQEYQRSKQYNGRKISSSEFDVTSDNAPQEYPRSKQHNGRKISSSEFDVTSDNASQEYPRPKQHSGRKFSSSEFDVNKDVKPVNKPQYKENILPIVVDKKPLKVQALVTVVYAHSPNSFYLQNIENVDAIEIICNTLSRKCIADANYTPHMNEICAAVFDGSWYRALVTGIKADACRVFYIDFGNYEDVKLGDMCKIPPELEDIPKMSDRCALLDIFPSNEEWSREAKDLFRQQSIDKEFIIDTVLAKSDFYCVKLKYKQTNEDLGQILIDNNMGRLKNAKPSSSSPSSSSPSQNSLQVDYKVPNISTGEKVELYTIFEGSDFFYSHIKKISEGPHKFLEWEKNMAQSKPAPLKSVKKGDYIVALSPSLGSWYRALVLDVISANQTKVMFVDYGNEEVVEEIGTMKKEWVSPIHLFRFTSNKSIDDFLIEVMTGKLIRKDSSSVIISMSDNILEGELIHAPSFPN